MEGLKNLIFKMRERLGYEEDEGAEEENLVDVFIRLVDEVRLKEEAEKK